MNKLQRLLASCKVLIPEYSALILFCLAGKAIFNVTSTRTGVTVRFRILKSTVVTNRWAVSVYTNSTWHMLGNIRRTLRATKRMAYEFMPQGNLQQKGEAGYAFAWFWINLTGYCLTPKVKIDRAKKCGRCGRELVDPESIKRGLGPHCYKIINKEIGINHG